MDRPPRSGSAVNVRTTARFMMSMHNFWCSVRLIKIMKRDQENSLIKHIVSSQYDVATPRCPVIATDMRRHNVISYPHDRSKMAAGGVTGYAKQPVHLFISVAAENI